MSVPPYVRKGARSEPECAPDLLFFITELTDSACGFCFGCGKCYYLIMRGKNFFKTNPQKSTNKVTISSFMMGSLFFVLTLIITLDPNKFSYLIVFQLVLAIPLLYVSSLAYSKIGYWQDTLGWDILGWFTNTLGNLFVLNAVGLVAAKFNPSLAIIYFSLLSVLMIIYTLINTALNKKVWKQKVFKLTFTLAIIVFGGFLGV